MSWIRLLAIICWGCALVCQQPASGFFGRLGSKTPDPLATGSQRRALEKAASDLYAQGAALEKAGEIRSARNVYEDVINDYPGTDGAAAAQYRIAAIHQANEKWKKAFEAYQELIDYYPQSIHFQEAIEAQYAMASSLANQKRRFGVGGASPTRLIEWLEAITNSAPFSPIAPKAQFEIGKIYEDNKRNAEAVVAYRAVVDRYPDSPEAPQAQLRIGNIYQARTEKGSQDRASLRQAQEAYEDFLVKFPENEQSNIAESNLADLDESKAVKSLNIGRFYEKKKQYTAAVIYYKDAMQYSYEPARAEAATRIEALRKKAPNISDSPIPAAAQPQRVVRQAPVDLTERRDYVGPAIPASRRKPADPEEPAMRTPVDEPAPLDAEVDLVVPEDELSDEFPEDLNEDELLPEP